jgi:hypothetical protein
MPIGSEKTSNFSQVYGRLRRSNVVSIFESIPMKCHGVETSGYDAKSKSENPVWDYFEYTS